MDCSLFFLLAVWACTERFISQATAEQTESCPDSVLGNERRSSCPKRCQTDKDCPGRRRCLCDGQCGLSCVTPGRTCPWPLPLNPNTVSLLLSPAPSFSALLETRCQPGFAMDGSMEAVVRRCQGDRRWSGEDPTCTAVPAIGPRYCPLPDEIRNEFTIKGSSAVGSNILYSCHPGFKLVGNRENFCQQNQTWQYPHPICQRVFCPPPVEVDHGYLVAVQRQEYEVGEDIYYLCKKTFLLDGPNRVNCQSNGTWSEVPFCRARCTVPAQRSRVTLGGLKLWPYEIPDGTVQHGDNITFYCKHPEKQCSFTAVQSCFDGELPAPDCYLEPTWLQYKIFPHRLVSEIELCNSSD
ncbi:beta-2-glycoprotein 1-like isoform X1 [Brienomyrus brachyistius]|uniref:beta-2-glycoprotein 1-like isoform X1 n=1 Tax=Brienomyrus brachyistius TaxID=42636 RepID=UPI0020B32070|nr:beta-2-glycoprotein 1-like isoform X1 [Brienomyrus brachyistius]